MYEVKHEVEFTPFMPKQEQKQEDALNGEDDSIKEGRETIHDKEQVHLEKMTSLTYRSSCCRIYTPEKKGVSCSSVFIRCC